MTVSANSIRQTESLGRTAPVVQTQELIASAAVPVVSKQQAKTVKAQAQASQSAAACLYALDSSASQSFYITGSTSISTSCSVVVESSAGQAFYMSGTETLDLQNSAQVGVVGGYALTGQTSIVNTTTGKKVTPVTITSPGDPLAFLPVPTSGTIIGKSHTSYDMNNKPANNTLSPGVYCGGLTIGNTNGATFTMSPGTYIMAGSGLTINSLGIVSGSGVTVYNTSSTGRGCSASSSYTPITISGQANVTLSAPTSGSLAGVILFGDRAGYSTVGSCQDQINGGASTTFNGAMYFKSDTLLFNGNNSSNGCMTAVADKINFNGNSSYAAVGNRRQQTSTLAAIPSSGLLNYDANDRTANNTYDNNGNIVSLGGIADSYDFENHLLTRGGISYQYDGDGNRVSKTIGGVTTSYLVDTLNPTGYAQVLDELQSNSVTRNYTWGLQLVSESQLNSAIQPPLDQWTTSWYGFDGHGSVRYLTSSTGAVTDTYDYDAFGNLINSTGSTANNYLFAGEQFDPDLGLYYNRARYLDVRAGRFWGMDTRENQNLFNPSESNTYAYVMANPVDRTDPSGEDGESVAELTTANFAMATLAAMTVLAVVNVLNKVKFQLPIRANHYTRWEYLPSIMSKGIDSPTGDNYSPRTSTCLQVQRSRCWRCQGNHRLIST
jgi:RHS repeat-associated protein